MLISCKNICKSFGIDIILENIDFQINEGDKIGLVGINGSGKTTLFKILTKSLNIDSGEYYIQKDITIGYLSQNLNLNNDNILYKEVESVFQDIIEIEKKLRTYESNISVLSQEQENKEPLKLEKIMKEYGELQEIFEEKGGYQFQSKLKGTLIGLGFIEDDFKKTINKFSGGQKTRIALAKILLKNPELLLLDEPTNYLDINTIEWLENYISNYNGTVIIISHDRYFLDNIVNKIFEIENHKLQIYNGNYSDFIRLKKKNQDIHLHQYKDQQKEIKRQEEIIKRFRQYNREKSIKKAESREKALQKIELIDKPLIDAQQVQFKLEPQVISGKLVLSVETLSKVFENKPLFKNISFELYRGDKVGIIGDNGIGKSTLIKILLDKIKGDSGEYRFGHNVFPQYYDQEQEELSEESTILDEVWQSKPFASLGEIRNILATFIFKEEEVFKTISSLSGGEKSRVSLAKLMLSKANLLIMDEPTNHLDIATKEVLEDALIKYQGSLLVISHDRYFLNKVVNRLFVFTTEGIKEYIGNYQNYIEKKSKQELLDKLKREEKKPTKTQLKAEKKKERINIYKIKYIKNEISNLEIKISSLENEIKNIENLMCQEDFYIDVEKSSKIHSDYTMLKIELDQVIEFWTEKQIELEESLTGN